MDIIIGREEGARRLHCIADGREFNVGQAGSVPGSVSRKHCKLTVNGKQLTITNLKEQNITFVDGNQIFSKGITPSSKVQLGKEMFLIPLQDILSLATSSGVAPTKGGGAKVNSGSDPTQQPKTYSLRPLQPIWEEYDRRKLEIQNAAAKNANMSRLQGLISMSGMCLGFIPGITPNVRLVIIVIALLLGLFFFFHGMTNDTVQKQLHDLDEELAKKYKCPNPYCDKPFGSIPYRQIEFNKQCLACGCKYSH